MKNDTIFKYENMITWRVKIQQRPQSISYNTWRKHERGSSVCTKADFKNDIASSTLMRIFFLSWLGEGRPSAAISTALVSNMSPNSFLKEAAMFLCWTILQWSSMDRIMGKLWERSDWKSHLPFSLHLGATSYLIFSHRTISSSHIVSPHFRCATDYLCHTSPGMPRARHWRKANSLWELTLM